MAFQQPRPGHPVLRGGLPYLYATWIAKLLGGDQCLWSAHFKSRYRYAKHEEQGEQLAEWNREHTALMRARRLELEENGWTVSMEEANSFKLEGAAAVVAGKPDIVATLGNDILIVDGKTGRERDSDIWQLLLYLFAWPMHEPAAKDRRLLGEVHYKRGDKRVPVKVEELALGAEDEIVRMIKRVSADQPPTKAPSRAECSRCTIGPLDCPQRITEDRVMTAVSGF